LVHGRDFHDRPLRERRRRLVQLSPATTGRPATSGKAIELMGRLLMRADFDSDRQLSGGAVGMTNVSDGSLAARHLSPLKVS